MFIKFTATDGWNSSELIININQIVTVQEGYCWNWCGNLPIPQGLNIETVNKHYYFCADNGQIQYIKNVIAKNMVVL